MNKLNADQWVACTRRLAAVAVKQSNASMVDHLILTRTNPVFHELVNHKTATGFDNLLGILKKTCANKDTMALLWIRQLSKTDDQFCLYNDLKHLFTFFNSDLLGRQMISLALASLPYDLFDFALEYSSKDKPFIGKVLDIFEEHLIDAGLYRLDYKEILTKLNQIRNSKKALNQKINEDTKRKGIAIASTSKMQPNHKPEMRLRWPSQSATVKNLVFSNHEEKADSAEVNNLDLMLDKLLLQRASKIVDQMKNSKESLKKEPEVLDPVKKLVPANAAKVSRAPPNELDPEKNRATRELSRADLIKHMLCVKDD